MEQPINPKPVDPSHAWERHVQDMIIVTNNQVTHQPSTQLCNMEELNHV